MASQLQLVSNSKCWGGQVRRYSHKSAVCGDVTMHFHVFFPPSAVRKLENAAEGQACPVRVAAEEPLFIHSGPSLMLHFPVGGLFSIWLDMY